jgi:sugar phosphate permease
MGFTQSFLWFFGCIFLISIGAGGCTSVVLMSVIANWFKSHVGKAMGIVACGFGAGGALVPLNVWLVDSFSWRTASIIIGIGMLASGLPALIVIRNDPRKYGYAPDGKMPDPLDTDLGEADKNSSPQFRDALRNRIYWLLNISEVFRMMVVTAVVMHVMPYLGSLGMDRFRAGLVASAIPLISIFGRIGFGWLGDVISKQKVIAVCLGFTAIGLIAFSNAETRWFILPFLFFFSPGFGGNTSLRGAIIQDHFGTNSFGKLLGVTMGISSIGGFLGPPLAGWSFDNLGGYQIMWQVFSIAVGACALFMFFVKPAKTK